MDKHFSRIAKNIFQENSRQTYFQENAMLNLGIRQSSNDFNNDEFYFPEKSMLQKNLWSREIYDYYLSFSSSKIKEIGREGGKNDGQWDSVTNDFGTLSRVIQVMSVLFFFQILYQ